jgi:glycine betaine/choline ABC-type transport system substrate-binding protein
VIEIYAQALEIAGYRVTRKYDEGDGLEQALLREEVDLYTGYTGTAAGNPGLLLLDPVRANYAWGLGMLKENADEKGIEDISDLGEKAAGLVMASTQDFFDDPAGLAMLNEVYGKPSFRKTAIVSADELHMPFHSGVVDVIPLRAIDGHLANPKHILLKDDRYAFTPQHLVPVVRTGYIGQNEQIGTILNSISKTLDDIEVIALNFKVTVQGIPPSSAAREYLKENGFLKRFKKQ